MAIERVGKIFFDDLGTLIASTRWISTHDEGIAEWLKNTRRAYQIDRANVPEQDRICVLLFKDSDANKPARIGLDVGGATLEDVETWSKWNDPQASSRGSSYSWPLSHAQTEKQIRASPVKICLWKRGSKTLARGACAVTNRNTRTLKSYEKRSTAAVNQLALKAW